MWECGTCSDRTERDTAREKNRQSGGGEIQQRIEMLMHKAF